METSQRDHTHTHNLPCSSLQDERTPPQDPDYFSFLKSNDEKHLRSPSFSKNGLSQDIINVTGAEPDICLEVFYALYNTLCPQVEKLSDVSFNDAWKKFIGGSIVKGSLTPPEKLITEKKVRDIRGIMSESGGENRIFQDLDNVIKSISDLKQKVIDYPSQILQKEEIIKSLSLVHAFYLGFRNKMKTLVQTMLEKEKINVSYASESDALEDLLEHKAIMMSDSFNQHWAYRIPRSQAQKLLSLDVHGRNLQSNINDPANHRVIALPENVSEPLVFFKANGNVPIQPEKEFMLYSLYQHLKIPVPETALLILTDVFERNSDNFYAVQASEAVPGESSLKFCQDKQTNFQDEAYVSQVIGALLTNPSDGSFKNFKYSPTSQTLISIDNDLIFKPELTGEENKKIVNVKSILYLLPQIDQPIPKSSTKTFFTTLDPYLTVFAWLQDLSQKNKKYQLLFARLTFQQIRCIYQNLPPQVSPPSLKDCIQKKVYVDSELQHSDSFYPQIFVSKNIVENLAKKLQKIGDTLSNSGSRISTQTLFEQVSPVLGKYYEKLRTLFTDPKISLNALWGNKINKVDYSLILSLLTPQELSSLVCKNLFTLSDGNESNPEDFFKDCKNELTSGESPLDRFIRRHSQRKKENCLDLQEVLKELRFLAQEGLTSSQCPRDIIDFIESISRTIDCDLGPVKEITSFFSNLPHPELKWLLTLEKYFIRPERERYLLKGSFPSSLSVLGAFMKKRIFILAGPEKQYVFDSHGDLKRHASLTGRSNVTCFPKENSEFYMKQYPELPGYEYASISFMRLLGIKHLPYQDLIIMNSSSKENSYPVLLTQKVNGDPVHKVWHNCKAFHNLDPLHTGLLIIAAMLLNPEDGKEDNFILTQDGKHLIPIDNDHCFLPSTFQKKGKFWNAFTVNRALQTKTLLFCLDEMIKPIPPEVKESLLAINWDLLLPKWMIELVRIDDKYDSLVESDQHSRFLEQGTAMRMRFYEQFIENIHWKAHKITSILNATSEPTPFDLLKAVEPFAAKCYEDSFKQGDNLQDRFKAATNLLYTKTVSDGSRVSVLNTRMVMEITNVPEKELRNEGMFQKMGPVKALEELNKLIQRASHKIRMEQELLCELDEKDQEKKWFHLFRNPLMEKALKDFFTNQQEGLILKGSRLITRSRLTELFAQEPDKGMRIRFLSLPESPSLTDEEIRVLAQECPNLEYLNVSSCAKLKQIFTFKGEWPLLARLEAKDCLNLEKFVSYSPLKILKIETHHKIEIFVEKYTLDIFIISTKEKSFELTLRRDEEFQMKSWGYPESNDDFLLQVIRQNESVEQRFRDRQIKIQIGMYSINSARDLAAFATNLNLSTRYIEKEDLERIVLLNLINLNRLELSNKFLRDGDFLKCLIQGNWPKLCHLNLSDSNLGDDGSKILAQGNWPELEILNLQNTRITAIGVGGIVETSRWPKLKSLNLAKNQIFNEGIEKLTQGSWPLETLDLSRVGMTGVGVAVLVNQTEWTQLKFLSLSGNEINDRELEILSRGSWPLLETLYLLGARITKKALLLLILKLNWQSLKEIKHNISPKNFAINLLPKDWPRLEELDLSCGEITPNEIKIIVNNCQWTSLKHLDLSQNWCIKDEALTILSQGNWPLLETLNLSSTRITKAALLNFILEIKWSNLKEINFDLDGKNFAKYLLPKDWLLLEELDLKEGDLSQHEIDIIVNKYNWPSLKHLDLSQNCCIKDKGLTVLSRGNWPLLETLNLSSTGVTKAALLNFIFEIKWSNLKKINSNLLGKDLAKNLLPKNWPFLEELDLSRGQLTENEIEGIVKKGNWSQVKYLDLSDNDIHDKGIEMLSRGNWPLLEMLNLRCTKITAVGVEIVVRQTKWVQLKHLDLSANWKINNEGLEVLSSARWPQLEILNLSETGITARGIESLVNKSDWPSLKKLNVSFNSIQDEGLKLLSLGKWKLLESLYLQSISITEEGIKSMASTSDWPNLKTLNLSANSIFSKGFENLASGRWPLLEYLHLNQINMNLEHIETLLNIPSWPNLREISFVDCFNSGVAAAKARISWKWPNIKIRI